MFSYSHPSIHYIIKLNEYVAHLSGIAVKKIKFISYTLCGLFAAIASIYLAARLAGGGPKIGQGYALDSITTIVVGGVSLSGGIGSVMAGFGGVLLLSIFNNVINLLDVNPFYQIVQFLHYSSLFILSLIIKTIDIRLKELFS